MQTILGAGGAIGTMLAMELSGYTENVRLVSRNPEKVNDSDELLAGDLLDPLFVNQAVEGSQVVYLTVGFPYKYKIWKKNWPLVMNNVMNACKKYRSRLVFFDNVYMYDRDYLNHMTEYTPICPTSRKGEVRAEIARELMEEVKKGYITALIARAADFIGSVNSIPAETIYKNYAKGKKAQWMGKVDKVHNFTDVFDAAKATALLGNTPDAYNQVWHLPTDHTPMTGKQWIELFAEEMVVEPRYTIITRGMLGTLGVFVPLLRELKEMAYQYDRDYFFDSTKFEMRFDYKPMTPKESVQSIVHEQTEGNESYPAA